MPQSLPRPLRVGELAKLTGLTVRTLHHYDHVGLVKPSGRSEAGYRLYAPADLQRLHTVMALRQLGFALPQIAQMLQHSPTPLTGLVAAQIEAIDRDIAHARALRAQLQLLQEVIAPETASATTQLLETLRLMEAYQRHFPADELPALLQRWQASAEQRHALVAEAQAAMQQGLPHDAPAVQALAQRWMDWAMTLTDGNLNTATRWADMHANAPETARHQGLAPDVLDFMGAAIGLRLAAYRRHLSEDELHRLDKSLAPRWQALVDRALRIMRKPRAEHTAAARQLLTDWDVLAVQMAQQDPVLHAKLLQAHACEPLLQHGHVVPPEVRAFVAQIRVAQTTQPDTASR